MNKHIAALLILLPACATTLFPVERATGRYALILADSPVAESSAIMTGRGALASTAAQNRLARIRTAQAALRTELARLRIPVTGSVQILLNAVFVQASAGQEAALRSLPGVKGVVPVARMRLLAQDPAMQLVNAPGAWSALGGQQNAGAGIKIAIIDTGIDQNHPAFQNPSLSVPPGFPICDPQYCAGFTNNKVIVARSYVTELAAGTQPNPAADSRPDDLSPRDHVGHGTALASLSAGVANTGPSETITGMAPQAWLGNYKIFGSPGVNDFTTGDVTIMALEDALKDGMDVAVISSGSSPLTGPLDTGAICGNAAGVPCDPEAIAVENAVHSGMSVVVAAGNEGDTGNLVPTLNTISTPATAPSAIAAAATTNSQTFVNAVHITDTNVPADLQTIPAAFGDGPLPASPVTAPLVDVANLGNDGYACVALNAGSLNGAIALIARGTCTFQQKAFNAQNAGAAGVIFYRTDGSDALLPPGGLTNIQIPTVLIGSTDGAAAKSYADANPDAKATIDPNLVPISSSSANTVAEFSSRGPDIGTGALKPEIASVGTDLYMATESFDPNSPMYDASGYTAQSGTSFSSPVVAGAVALAKQKNPSLTALQLRSSLINTASQDITDSGTTARVTAVGAGKLDAGSAVASTATVEPATISFGVLGAGQVSRTQQLLIHNTGSGPLNLAMAVSRRTTDVNTDLTLDKSSLSLPPGQSGTVTVALAGRQPAPGSYEGAVTITGGAVPLRVPFLYLVSDGVPFNIFPVLGAGFDGAVGQPIPDGAIAFRLIDRYGVPIPSYPVQFSVTRGGGSIQQPDSATDANGVAGALAILGPRPGAQEFVGQAGNLSVPFDGNARVVPAISPNGAVNAASFAKGQAVAPGSYISLFGSGLSDTTAQAATANLPLALNDVSVSFDAGGLSLPGHLFYVSPGLVNVQAPWELAGQSSAQIKVTIGDVPGALYTLPLAQYSPGIFQVPGATGQQVAAARDENFILIDSNNPARAGSTIQIYANGLGPVSNQPASGEATPTQPLAETTATPTVTIGGKNADVSFSGLTPTVAGLYQINVTVPQGLAPGLQPVTVSIGGVTSNTANLPVQ